MFILIGGVGTSKNITLKLIIQGLLWLYNKKIYSNLIKTKTLLMASTCKVAFNINGLVLNMCNNFDLVY